MFDLLELHGDSDTPWADPRRARDLLTSEVEAHANYVEPLMNSVRCTPKTQSLSMAEREQKRLLLLANRSLNFGRLRMTGWQDMFFAAEAQLDYHPMPRFAIPTQRVICSYEGHYGHQPDASIFIARSGQSGYYMADGHKMTSGHHMCEAGYFVHPSDESRGRAIRSPYSRKIALFRNVYVVRDPKTRHARLALSDDLIGRHGAFDTAPTAYRIAVRALYAHSVVELQGTTLIVKAPPPPTRQSPSPSLLLSTPTASTSWHPSSLGQDLASKNPLRSS